MRGVHSLHPAPPGRFLYFGSELGGGDGASDPSTDSRASCLKKSAGEWRVGGSRLGCAPRGHLPALHTRMSTRVSHHSFISSSLTTCHIPPPPCKPGDERLQGVGQGERGRKGGAGEACTPTSTHVGTCNCAGVSLDLPALEVVAGSAVLCGVPGGCHRGKVPPPHVQRPVTDQHLSE